MTREQTEKLLLDIEGFLLRNAEMTPELESLLKEIRLAISEARYERPIDIYESTDPKEYQCRTPERLIDILHSKGATYRSWEHEAATLIKKRGLALTPFAHICEFATDEKDPDSAMVQISLNTRDLRRALAASRGLQ